MKIILFVVPCAILVLLGSQESQSQSIFAAHRVPGDEYWWDGFSDLGIPNAYIGELIEYNCDLIVCGDFDWAGNLPVSNIVSWNGQAWSTLDSGIDNDVTCLTVYQGDLIAGGNFHYAGGQEARRLARWDGSSWSAQGTFNATVHNLSVFQDELYVSGVFDMADNRPLGTLVRFDGEEWHSMGIPGSTRSGVMIEFNGKLIAYSEYFPGLLAEWNGQSWDPLGLGVNDYVADLIVFEGMLFAGGNFDLAGGQPANLVACWDGEDWSPVGSGIDLSSHTDVNSFSILDGQLYVCGEFWTAAGVPVNHIALWNGAFWAPLGSGLSYRARASEVFQGALYVGGDFEYAGGHPSESIARWDPSPGTAVDQLPLVTAANLHAFPNPFNPSTTIMFALPEPQYVTLSIHDSSGRCLINLIDELLPAGTHTRMWNGYDGAGLPLPSGIYFAAVKGQGFSDVTKLVLLK